MKKTALMRALYKAGGRRRPRQERVGREIIPAPEPMITEAPSRPKPRPKKRKKRKPPHLHNAVRDVPLEEAEKPSSPYRVPDTWEKPKGARPEMPDPMRPVVHKISPEAIKKVSITFTVSTIQKWYIKKYCYDRGITMSEMMRVLITKFLREKGQELPDPEEKEI